MPRTQLKGKNPPPPDLPPSLPKSEGFPFCSDRRRRIDLGKWASGD
jgi:hypothetical protein